MSDKPSIVAAEVIADVAAGVTPGTQGPRTVQEARRQVEASRERISATLEELEDRIVETKASIQRKVDVVRPARNVIRKAPFVALGVAVAVGVFLGTRGGDDEDEDEYGYGFEKSERKALEEWRERRRRMLLEEGEEADDVFEELEEDGKPSRFGGFFRMIGHELAGVAVGIVAAEIAERMYGARAEDDDEADDDSEGDVISDDDVIFDEDDGA
jgi:hypothetical protein